MSENDQLPTVCILAGGIGSRLGELTSTTPKPLIEVAGEPFLFHQLRLLSAHGVEHVVLCVGYLGELIEERMGSLQFGIAIDYSYDAPGLEGTLGAIRRAQPLLGDQFLFLYGDTYLRIDYADVARSWLASASPAVMTVLHNAGQWGTSNAEVQGDLVVAYDKAAPTPEMEWIDYGLGGLSTTCLDLVGPETRDLSQLQSVLATRRWLRAYRATERFYEIGTPSALEETARVISDLGDGIRRDPGSAG